KDASRYLPSIRHLAKSCRLDCRWDFGRYGLDRGEDCDPRRSKANKHKEVDRVLNDVPLRVEVRKYIDGRIGDEQRFGMARHVHHEDMAYSPRRSQTCTGARDSAHELIGMQAALHQQLTFRFMNQLHRLGGGGVTIACIDDLKTVDIEL